MKKMILTTLIALMISTCVPVSYAAENLLDKPYSPTRQEWLQSSIFQSIKIGTDAWRQRISSIIWVVEKENTVYITLTSANGQDILDTEAKQNYILSVKNIVESVLSKYEWSKNLKVSVQFV